MPSQTNKAYKSYMKPVASRVTIQKPEQKRTAEPQHLLPDGFTRISEVKIRKVYGQPGVSACIFPGNGGMVAVMGDTNPKNNQKKKAQQSAKKASGQKKPAAPSVPAARKK